MNPMPEEDNNNTKRSSGHSVPRQRNTMASSTMVMMTMAISSLLALSLSSVVVVAQDSNSRGAAQQQQQQDGAAAPASTSSFVLADPNSGAAQSAYSPPAEPSPIIPASQPQQQQQQSMPSASDGITSDGTQPLNGGGSGGSEFQEQMAPNDQQQRGSGGTAAASGGYGTLPSGGGNAASADGTDPLLGSSMSDAPPQESALTSAPRQSEPNNAKRRQFNQYAVPVPEPALLGGIGVPALGPGAVPAAGTCPGGASLPIECDPKRPWPQCPPQSYCYATNTVDIGPYFCCPVWSTYGAAWRPATPFYNYAPPPPPNWPEPMRMASAPWAGGVPAGPIRKERKEQRIGDDGGPLMTQDEQRKILQVMNDWVERQKASSPPAIADEKKGTNGTAKAKTSDVKGKKPKQ